MGKVAPFLLLVLLAGCAGRERSRPLRNVIVSSPADAPRCTPNLALGANAADARLAELFARRTDWPAVETGYRLDDQSFGTEYIFSDESFYDALGGGFDRGVQSVRTSVLLR
jgi:hypothetical protein